MENDLEQRVRHLEEQMRQLEQQLANERVREVRRLRRERWIRVGVLIAVATAYALYLPQVMNIPW